MIDFERIDTLQNFPLIPAVSSSFREVDASPEESPRHLYFAKKYVLRWQCGIAFYANNATLHDAQLNAERAAIEFFHQGVLRELQMVKAIAYKYSDPELHRAVEKAIAACSKSAN